MGKLISIINEELGFLTDDEIRELASTEYSHLNGEYAIEICKGCGAYYTEPDVDTKDAEIIDECRNCFRREK